MQLGDLQHKNRFGGSFPKGGENMKDIPIEQACPKCGQIFTERPAVSRVDGITLICPDCGTREALASLGVDPEEQDKIIEIIHEKAQ
jgi:predicted RNA-binding Zn-ribbon protein involved in translation (DUF1610 family)